MNITKSGSRKLAAQFAGNNRFMYTAEDWTTDSYSAIAAHIEPNSPRVLAIEAKVKIQLIIDKLAPLQLVKTITDDGNGYVTFHNDNTSVRLNAGYLANLQIALGGYAWPRLTGDNSAVAWVDDENKIVALLMPVHN